jgi:hypothetical protein
MENYVSHMIIKEIEATEKDWMKTIFKVNELYKVIEINYEK